MLAIEPIHGPLMSGCGLYVTCCDGCELQSLQGHWVLVAVHIVSLFALVCVSTSAHACSMHAQPQSVAVSSSTRPPFASSPPGSSETPPTAAPAPQPSLTAQHINTGRQANTHRGGGVVSKGTHCC